MMIFQLGLILGAVVLGVAGELLLKSGIDSVEGMAMSSIGTAVRTAWHVISEPRIVVGFTCYGVAAVLWLVVLSQWDLSYAYPMLALTYMLVPLAAHYFLDESIPRGRWAGIFIVLIGVIVVAYFQPPE